MINKDNQKPDNSIPKKMHRKGQRPVQGVYVTKERDIKKREQKRIEKTNIKETSWGKEAKWYDKLLEENADTFQSKVILPNLVRILNPKPSDTVVELGCGQGFFSRVIAKSGARVIGVDIGKELIEIAEARADKEGISSRNISFYTASADNTKVVVDKSADAVIVILALQNMKNLQGVISEIKRITKRDARVILVLNHPTFRVIKNSDWGFDEATKTQYRKVSKYLSQFEVDIDMHPGDKSINTTTKSFHRSLQDYMKVFAKEGFAITRLEEWISHRESQKGPRQLAEDTARKEIPMFMCVELQSLKS
jgi:ubiquinone/menaquinone biosynthesis C-methylase UbiE